MVIEIPKDLFDPAKLKARKFIGKVLTAEVKQSEKEWMKDKETGEGRIVFHQELDNLSTNLNFTYDREILPFPGPNTIWTKTVEGYRKCGIVLGNNTIPTLTGKTFWFEELHRAGKGKDKEGNAVEKDYVDYIPSSIPTASEITDAETRRSESGKAAIVKSNGHLTSTEIDSILLSLADGMSPAQLVDVLLQGYPTVKDNNEYVEALKKGEVTKRLASDKKLAVNKDGTFKVLVTV